MRWKVDSVIFSKQKMLQGGNPRCCHLVTRARASPARSFSSFLANLFDLFYSIH
jgi:hypothetical protein